MELRIYSIRKAALVAIFRTNRKVKTQGYEASDHIPNNPSGKKLEVRRTTFMMHDSLLAPPPMLCAQPTRNPLA